MGVGVGEAGLSPAAYSLIVDSVEKKHLSKAISATAGIYLGGGMALIVGGMVIQWAAAFSTIHAADWRMMCKPCLAGLPGICWCWHFTLKEPARSKASSGKGVPVSEVVAFLNRTKKPCCCINWCGVGVGGGLWRTGLGAELLDPRPLLNGRSGSVLGLTVCFVRVKDQGTFADRWFRQGRTDAKMRVAM